VALRPESRGWLQLASADPTKALRIHQNFLKAQNDWKVLRAGVRIFREIAHQESFDRFRGPEILPGAAKTSDADIDALLEVERRATALLLGHGAYDLFAMHSLSPQNLRDGIAHGILQVAEIGGQAVGFALCGEIDGDAHLFEMDVMPEHGRRGVGSALLESVCRGAAESGFSAMTLTTLRDVPWNAPFYAGRGFAELPQDEWGAQLAGIVDRERMLGFPMRLRVVMKRRLRGSEY
jgi:GNAT superfamily N-acetyltransferase